MPDKRYQPILSTDHLNYTQHILLKSFLQQSWSNLNFSKNRLISTTLSLCVPSSWISIQVIPFNRDTFIILQPHLKRIVSTMFSEVA